MNIGDITDITEKVEAGIYKPTVTEVLEGLTVDNLYQAHVKLENQSMIGKLVIKL